MCILDFLCLDTTCNSAFICHHVVLLCFLPTVQSATFSMNLLQTVASVIKLSNFLRNVVVKIMSVSQPWIMMEQNMCNSCYFKITIVLTLLFHVTLLRSRLKRTSFVFIDYLSEKLQIYKTKLQCQLEFIRNLRFSSSILNTI